MNDLRQRLGEIHALHALRSDYLKTLALLQALQAGDIGLDQIRVSAEGWQLAEPKELQIAATPAAAE